MIVRSIQIEGWQCFAAPLHIGPFADGLNIIHGPNGSGKSTLMMALARGLFDSHTVKGTDIKALQPWGRALAPKVMIEFEQQGSRYQLHKQFLSGEFARLDRQEGGAYVPIAESRAADEQARALLSGEPTRRGATDQRHWGLAQILWATQGSLAINELAAGTRASIQEALGAQIIGPGTETCEQRIATEYELYFTPTGKLKGGATAPAVVALEKQRSAAIAQRDLLLQQLDAFTTASRRIEDLQRQVDAARHDDQDIHDRLGRLRQQAQEYQRLRDQQVLYRHELASSEESYRHLSQRMELIRATSAELDQATQRLRTLRQDTAAHESLAQQSRQDVRLKEDQLRQVRSRQAELANARRMAQSATRYIAARDTRAELDERLMRVEAAQAELEARRTIRRNLVAPDKETWAKITRIARERDDARLQLDAALMTVHVQLESDHVLEVTRGEDMGAQTLPAGQSRPLRGAPDVAFRIPGVGSFLATGPTGDFDALRRRWESAVTRLEEQMTGFGTRDLAELERMTVQAEASDQQIREADAKLEVLLHGEPVDQLRSRQTRAAGTIGEILTEIPAWQHTPPDPAEYARQVDELERQLSRQTELAESALAQAQQAWQQASTRQAAHAEKRQAAEANRVGIETRLASLRQDQLTEEQRSARLTDVAMKRDAALGHLAHATERIEAFGDDPAKALAVVEGERKAVHAATEDAQKELHTATGQLQQIISTAPYSALADTDEEISRLTEEMGRQQLQLDAIRLLYQTLQLEKSNLVQSVIRPIRERQIGSCNASWGLALPMLTLMNRSCPMVSYQGRSKVPYRSTRYRAASRSRSTSRSAWRWPKSLFRTSGNWSSWMTCSRIPMPRD